MKRFCLCGRRMVDVPVFSDLIAVEPDAVAILSGEANVIVASLRRNDDTGPADGIFLQELRRDSGIAPGEIDGFIYPRKQRSAFEFYVGEIFTLDAVLFHGIIRIEHVAGNCAGHRTDEPGSLDVNDI